MQVYAVPNAYTTCPNGTVTAAPGGGSVTLSGATLLANSSCAVFVAVTSVKFLNLTNTIPIGAVSTMEARTNSASTSASLGTTQGLGVSKRSTPTSVAAGQPARPDHPIDQYLRYLRIDRGECHR